MSEVDVSEPFDPGYDQAQYLKERAAAWKQEFEAIIEQFGLDYYLDYQAGMYATRDNSMRWQEALRRTTAKPQEDR